MTVRAFQEKYAQKYCIIVQSMKTIVIVGYLNMIISLPLLRVSMSFSVRSNFHVHCSLIANIHNNLDRWRFHTLFSDKPPPTRTPLIRILSPLLFFAPDRHLEQLQLVNPAEFIFEQSWSEFIAARERPWNDFILYVCIIVSPIL